MTQVKKRTSKRLVNFILAMAMVIGMIPTTTITAFAASGTYQLSKNEINSTWLLDSGGPGSKKPYHLSPSQYDRIMNYGQDTSSPDYQGFSESSWFWPAYEELMDMGVILGIQTNHSDTNSPIYMPTLPTSDLRSKTDADGFISGQDALGAALLYYYGTINSPVQFLSYKNKTRSEMYKNAADSLGTATGVNKSFFKNFQDESHITRGDAFVIIASIAAAESGNKVKLSNYSDSELGFMAGGSQTMPWWNQFAGPGIGVTLQDGNYIIMDTSNVIRQDREVIQAVNLLLDVGAMHGRDNPGKKFPNEVVIDCEYNISYAEFYDMLFRMKHRVLDNIDDGNFTEPQYLTLSKFTLNAHDDEISYRDFLDGGTATLRVDASANVDASGSVDYTFDVYENTYGANGDESGRNASRTFRFDYSADDVDFTERVARNSNGEKTYSVKFYGSVEAALSDDDSVSDSKSDTDTGRINIVNYQPSTTFTATTDTLASPYNGWFYYTNMPITIRDSSSDYEDAVEEWHYKVKKGGSTVASLDLTKDGTPTVHKTSAVKSLTGNPDTSAMSLTFAQTGTYTIEGYCVDEMGKKASTYTKTIRVTGDPTAPTAKLSGLDKTYQNRATTITDVSTDPNDDIVKWVWDPQVLWFDAVLDENGDETEEGTWVVAKEGVDYTVSGASTVNLTSQSRPTVSRNYTFKTFGRFRIGMTVTDATKLSDKTYHEITVLDNVPIAPDPEFPPVDVYYTVKFINTDGTTKEVSVKAGEYVKTDDIPAIIDLPGITEHGWTQDGQKLVEPDKVKVDGNITFNVLTTTESTAPNTHVVTFANTDGTRKSVIVPHMGRVPGDEIPVIIDLPDMKELGWTDTGAQVVTPSAIDIDRDRFFWVLTEKIVLPIYHITFVNTDGSVTEISVPQGEAIPKDKIPDIIDLPGLIEEGWIDDTLSPIPDPSTIVPTRDIVFKVKTTPTDENGDPDTRREFIITFINSDGEVTRLLVKNGDSIPADKIPEIVDLPDFKENGWTRNGVDLVDPKTVIVDCDIIFWVDKTPTKPVTHKVTFVNTDGTTTVVEVPNGEPVPSDKVPDIIDVKGKTEEGWTIDDKEIVDPTKVPVTEDTVYHVKTTPEEDPGDKSVPGGNPDPTPGTHTVTFVNTDGTITKVPVKDGDKVSGTKVPTIKDLPGRDEKGWTKDGEAVIDPTTVTIKENTTFYVKTEPEDEKSIPGGEIGHDPDKWVVTFVNTDGTATQVDVADGETVPAAEIPSIIDLPGRTEDGWTRNGTLVEDPETVVIHDNTVFFVKTTPTKPGPGTDPDDKDPDDPKGEKHLVTFINSDLTTTVIKVKDGDKIAKANVPDIIDLPQYTENGWTTDGMNVVDPTTITIKHDYVFWVDMDKADGQSDRIQHRITFVNSDGKSAIVTVRDGDVITANLVPAIIDMPKFIENGWTRDGESIEDPVGIVVKHDLLFWVDMDNVKTHTVTFVNTDGTTEVIEVPDGEKIPEDKVPDIVDVHEKDEKGWTDDGRDVVDPTEEPITGDKVFWVKTEDIIYHTVTFVNTDGTMTLVEVPHGTTTPVQDVPAIIDVGGIRENGWTRDGKTIIDPTSVVVEYDIVFWVDTTEDPDPRAHLVTFVNSDGSIVEYVVLHGGTVPLTQVPKIVDVPEKDELGWSWDGINIVQPHTVIVLRDLIFQVRWTEHEDPDTGIHIDEYGRLVIKVNEKVTIDMSSALEPPSDPIQWNRTDWDFSPVDGYDVENNIKFAGATSPHPTGKQATFVAKEVGEFTVTVTLHNNYTDELEKTKPNSKKLLAAKKTITVVVKPDLVPEVSLFVNNANPDFHNNPAKTNVTVASTALSPDHDILAKYAWKIIRDDNNDGNFEETPFYAKNGDSSLSTVNFDATFKAGVAGQYKAELTVTEDFSKPTLSEHVKPEEHLSSTATKEFEVNWTPCISYDLKLSNNAWAYVDDVIKIKTIVKDEDVSTCKVDWTLKKKVDGTYVAVTDCTPVWELGTNGGSIQIGKDGYYVLEAVITDDHGYSETFVSNEIRIYGLPTAVISDVAQYRWNNVQWQYKQSRRFDLNGDASYANDSTGEALHPLAHENDVWSITPIGDGATADAIYVLNDDGSTRLLSEEDAYFLASKNAFSEKVSIIKVGTYEVRYQVTNTYGKKSPVAKQVITIIEDLAPEIVFKEGSKQEPLGSEANDRYTTIGNMTATIKSTDADIIFSENSAELDGLVKARYRYDSNNDGNFEDETWVDLPSYYADTSTIINTNNGLLMLDSSKPQSAEATIKAHVNQLGWYQFELQVHEQFGQETLPILPDNVFQSFAFYSEVEVDNASPNGTFGMVNNVYADIVFAFGGFEEGQKTINKETAFTFGPGGNQLDAVSGEKAITLQPNDYTFEVYGARGGSFTNADGASYSGGDGAYVKTHMKITEPTTVYVNVGGRGIEGTGAATAGYNGGGAVGGGTPTSAAGGGGASMIALAPGQLGEVDKNQILVVAAGGGGAIDGQDGTGGNILTTTYDPTRAESNSDDNYSGGGGGGYYSGDAGVTQKHEVSYFDEWVIRELSCTDEEHTHNNACYEATPVLSCGQEEHQHTLSCTETIIQTDCGMEEHTHSSNCWGGMLCGKTEHTHDESCHPTPIESNACGKAEHMHSDSCYTEGFTTECGLTAHKHSDSCDRKWQGGKLVYQCGFEEHEHDSACYKVICGEAAHTHNVNCYTYYNFIGESGRGGYSYANSAKVTDTETEAGFWPQSGYVKIAYYTETVIDYSSSEYNEELLQKNVNFGNMFGEVPGANLFQLNVSTVETSSLNLADGINWNTSQMSSSIGYVNASADGLTVDMYGNSSNAGQNMMYCLDYQGEITFGFDYSLSWGDSFNGAGIVMNIKENTSTIDATIIWIPNRGGMGQAGIYDVTYTKGSNYYTTPSSYTCLKAFSLNTSGHLDIVANQGNIEVSGTGVGNQIYTATAPYHGDGFGFYSSHYGHACSSIGHFGMNNIMLEVSERKTLADTLSNTSFNVGNDAFVIWAEGTIPEELAPSSPTYAEDYQALLQKILDSNIHLIIFGSSTNQSVMNDLLAKVPVKGTFINSGTVDGDLAEARDFVASILRQHIDTNIKYILLNEDTVYDKYYSDYNGHAHWTANGDEDNIYSSRWWYMQDPDYFANSLGTIAKDKTWLANEITNFDKVGHFYVDYRVKDNAVPDAYLGDNSVTNPFDGNPDRHLTPEELEAELRHGYRYWSSNYAGVDALGTGYMYDNDIEVYEERLQTTLKTADGAISNQPAEIFVHRRPIAETVGVSTVNKNAVLTSITITDASYDIDHNDPDHSSYTPTKGLQQYEWTYYWYEGTTLKNNETKRFLNVDDGVTWINQMVSQYSYTPNTDIKVLYRVRDIDGLEVTESTTYDITLRGVLYAAPNLNDCADLTANERRTANSYRYAYTSEDASGIPAGTYVTQSYDEAIYVLKVDEEHKEARYQTSIGEYNDAVADREAKEATAATLESAAQAAETLRDNQHEVVTNWRTMQETKQRLKEEAEALLASYTAALESANTNLAEKQTALTEATTAYNEAKAAYDAVVAEMTSLDGNITRLTGERDVLQNQMTRLNGELGELNNELAALEQAEERDEVAIAEKQEAITAKQTEITTKQSELDAKQRELDDMVNSKPAKQAEIDTAKATMDTAKAAMDAAQSEYNIASTEQTAAQQKVDSQQAVVDQYTSEEGAASTRYFEELKKFNQLNTEANKARKAADDAAAALAAAQVTEQAKKDAMDNALAEYEAATAKKNAVQPLTMNAEVSTTQTRDLTIPNGVWSVLESKEYTSRPLKPIAKFVTNAITFSPGQEITVTDSSYSPNGNNIVKWKWTITRDGTEVGSKTYGPEYTDEDVSAWIFSTIDSQTLNAEAAKNKYKITLVVTDDKSAPLDSDPYSVTITISPENQAPSAEPNNTTTNIYKSDYPIVYEYDAYDANLNNPYYTYGGVAQKRGQEQLDWTLIIDDPDNHDKYGTANDSDTFDVSYQFERLKTMNISSAIDSLFSSDYTNYGPKTVSIAQAKDNSKIAPFAVLKDSGLTWGAYRITTTVTDKPNNGAEGKSAIIVTGNENPPKHLYVIPALSINDLHYTWDNVIDNTEQVPVADEMKVTFTTNGEVTSVFACMPHGAAVGGELKIEGRVESVNADGTKNWVIDAYVPDSVEEDDLVNGKEYTFQVEVNTTYGSDAGNITRTKRVSKKMNVLAIKLFDFRVAGIADPTVHYDGQDVYVPHLAFDRNNTTNDNLMKKGYSFNFKLTSMGLKGDTDEIRIRPTFYGYNEATGKYDILLDVYYKNDSKEYTLGTYNADNATAADDTFRLYSDSTNTSLLGTLREIRLNDDDREISGKEQTWSGRYGVPSTALFVKKGQPLTETNLYKGDVLIRFDIDAMKNNASKYNYLVRGQWAAERVNDAGSLIDSTKGIYEDGSVIVIDGTKNALDNYIALPVWRKS